MSRVARHRADTVVIGGGSSGAVVAGRLAEAGCDVLLVEAGPDYGPLDGGRWPAELVDARMLATTHDWDYRAGRWTFERARVIGGCSAHNGAIAAVGHRRDYDAWGLDGWRGADVEPLYRTVCERMRVRAYERHEAGPFHAACLEAAAQAGWPIASDLCDLDAGESFGLETVNVFGTLRWNTAFAYLDPVRGGGHLRVLDETIVAHLEPAGVPSGTVRSSAVRSSAVRSSAVRSSTAASGGVRVFGTRQGEPVEIEAATVVLSAGVYGTPAILQRSGVGDPDRLRAVGVTPQHELPGVGADLHDHPMIHAGRLVTPRLQGWLDEAAATGFLPEEQTLGKFCSGQATDGLYDLHLFPVCASNQTSLLHGRTLVEVACVNPRSRGRLDIVSADPEAQPTIDHAYLTDPEGHDLAVLRDGLALAERLLAQPALRDILGAPFDVFDSDEAIRANVAHYYHPVGTCRMGPDGDAGAVCDADGRVRGLDGVVVADVSLLPTITRANTNLPAVMIGERIAATLAGRLPDTGR
ncbi:MAG: GMC family oxidoreductase [Acidimicrobiia bacterium]